MPNSVTATLLFISSYAPLLVILAIRDAFGNRWIAAGLIALAALSVVGLLLYLRIASRLAPHPVCVSTSSSRDSEAMSYMVTYLLPFLGLNSGSLIDQISLGIFLIMLGILYIGSNLIHMNPMLNVFGYRVLEIESAEGKRTTLICRRGYIRPGTEIAVVSLADAVALEKQP